MNSYRDNLWILLGEWIEYIDHICDVYDTQLSFEREKFLDFIILTVRYTQSSQCKFLIKHIEDLDKVTKYLEIALLWP